MPHGILADILDGTKDVIRYFKNNRLGFSGVRESS